MSTPTSNASLALAPLDASLAIGLEPLAELTAALGLGGDAIEGRDGHFYAGDALLKHINFLGCSPHIEFDANAGEHFTHIVLHASDHPRLYHGRYTRPPLCPHCARPQRSWQQAQTLTRLQLRCDDCGETSPLSGWNWRRNAGVASCLIEITEIYPKEAQPQPGLMSALAERSGTPWHYFYF